MLSPRGTHTSMIRFLVECMCSPRDTHIREVFPYKPSHVRPEEILIKIYASMN